jgi:DNA-binding response OmpR family regulator
MRACGVDKKIRRGSFRVQTMTAGNALLIVDDDTELRGELSSQLTLHEGFTVEEAGTGEEGLAKAASGSFVAVLLDVGLPDMDGREVCRLLRQRGFKAPIIMLTAHAGEADTVEGLDSGANDYVTKPFRLGVLMARLRAHLRQFELSDDATFIIGSYSFRPAAKMLIRPDNRKIHLTEKETAILKYLYRVGDKPVQREVLLGEVWGYNAGVTTHTLETHIYRLRQKIEPKAGETALLVTEPGGYRLVR